MLKACGVLVLLLAGVAAAPVSAAPRVWRVDGARSTLAFTGTGRTRTCTGQFRRFTAYIAYDPNHIMQSRFDVRIDIASLDMQNRERAALGAAFLDAAKFPHAYFATTVFHKAADGGVVAVGQLKLRGVIKPVALEVAFVPHGDAATLDLSAHIKPLDFGIGSTLRSDTPKTGVGVTVHGHLVLTAKP